MDADNSAVNAWVGHSKGEGINGGKKGTSEMLPTIKIKKVDRQ